VSLLQGGEDDVFTETSNVLEHIQSELLPNHRGNVEHLIRTLGLPA
jgi:hypothetical protein